MNPRLRAIQMQPVIHRGQEGILLTDPLALKDRSLLVPSPLAPILPLMDGTRDAGALRTGFELRTGIPISPRVVEDLIRELDASLFLDNARFAEALRSATDEYRRAGSRLPIMAGRSCPGDPRELADLLQGYLDAACPATAQEEVPGGEGGCIKGLISPHIDFLRGGPVYGRVWAAVAPAVRDAELVIILGTDHNGGEGEITLTRQSYETPWGIVTTDQEVVERIATLAGEAGVFEGELRHRGEHSVEAALIWASYLVRDKACRSVPILCGSFGPFIRQDTCPTTSRPISATIEVLRDVAAKRRTILVAAGDLAHVGPAFGDLLPLDMAARASLEAQDRRLMGILSGADSHGFLEEIRSDGDQRRVCGVSPIYIMLAVLAGTTGSPVGYAQCPASEDGTSIVSICGMVYR